MNKRVYDIPTRVFHWLFAFSFMLAFSIANTIDDDHVAFSYHMIAGLIMLFCLLWRLIWGIWGSRYARFNDYSLNPSALIAYLKGILTGSTQKWAGHNPASSWAALTMMLLACGLGLSGILMAIGINQEWVEEIHELFANTFLIVVVLHLAGVVIHQLKHKDSFAKSMVSGKKQGLPESSQTVSRHVGSGLLVFLITVGFAVYLIQHFDNQTRKLTLLGVQLQLSEFEQHESTHRQLEHNSHQEKDDDD